MNRKLMGSTLLLVAGFSAGVLVSHFPALSAETTPGVGDISQKLFLVSIDEVRQNFVFGDWFTGHYTKTVTLSDGTERHIELTPMVHDGKQVVEFRDNGGHSYMGLSSTTTNGTLMVQIWDYDAGMRQLQAEGWSVPDD